MIADSAWNYVWVSTIDHPYYWHSTMERPEAEGGKG